MTERRPLPLGSDIYGYRVVRVLGVGGSALTYLAYQGPWDLPVALKEFFPSGSIRQPDGSICFHTNEARYQAHKLRFWREGQNLARFCHPGIVRVLHCFEHEDSAYLVQELLQGSTLKARMTGQPWPLEAVIQIAQDIVEALMVVHAGGLIHADIKPDNLFSTHQGRTVIIDFGLARSYVGGEMTGFTGYTPGYAPPEQQQGQVLTYGVDIFSLGATLYHLFTGIKPLDVGDRLAGKPLPGLLSLRPDLPATICATVDSCLELALERRPATMVAVLAGLGLSGAGKLHLPSVPGLHCQAEAAAHRGGVYCLALDEPGARLFSAGRDGWVAIWSWPNLQPLGRIRVGESPISCLQLLKGGQILLVGNHAGLLQLLDWKHDQGVVLLESGPAVNAASALGDDLLVARASGELARFQPGSPPGRGAGDRGGHGLFTTLHWEAHLEAVNSVDLCEQLGLAASGSEDGMIHLWTWPDVSYLASLPGHGKAVRQVAFSPDGSYLMSSGNDFCTRLWSIEERKQIREFRGHQAMVWSSLYTHSPLQIATVSADRYLRVYGLHSSRLLARAAAHEKWTRALVASLRSPLLATGGGDGSVRVWCLPTHS